MKPLYFSFNSEKNSSVYLFCIATKQQDAGNWSDTIPKKTSFVDETPANNGFDNYVGCHAIQNNEYVRGRNKKTTMFQRLFGLMR